MSPISDRLRLPNRLPAITSVWPNEASDFTPWLANSLHVLDVLGLGRLELVKREQQVPGTLRSLDILARRQTGELIAIENQFGKLDHDHMTRGLAYAVGLRAEALVLVAEDHLNEFRAVARYLNELAERSELDGRIGLYLVAAAADQVAEYYVPRFEVIEAPNPWIQATVQSTPPVRYATLDEFLATVADDIRPAVRAVCGWWVEDGGTTRVGPNSVSLDRPHPVKPKPLSYISVYKNGSYWLNRGYLLDAAVLAEGDAEDFDEFVLANLPDAHMGTQQYYVIGSGPPPLRGLQVSRHSRVAGPELKSERLAVQFAE